MSGRQQSCSGDRSRLLRLLPLLLVLSPGHRFSLTLVHSAPAQHLPALHCTHCLSEAGGCSTCQKIQLIVHLEQLLVFPCVKRKTAKVASLPATKILLFLWSSNLANNASLSNSSTWHKQLLNYCKTPLLPLCLRVTMASVGMIMTLFFLLSSGTAAHPPEHPPTSFFLLGRRQELLISTRRQQLLHKLPWPNMIPATEEGCARRSPGQFWVQKSEYYWECQCWWASHGKRLLVSAVRLVGAASAAALPCPGLSCWGKCLAPGCCWDSALRGGYIKIHWGKL